MESKTKFLVFFNKISDKDKGSIRIEVRDKASGEVVCPEMQIQNCSYEEFEKLTRGATPPNREEKNYVIEMEWGELRHRLSGLNRPALEDCFERVEEWMRKRGQRKII